MSLRVEQLRGLEWVQKTFSLEPRWTVEPDIGSIKRAIKGIRPSPNIAVSFLAQGAFNKLFNVQAGNEALVMRISLPVDPQYKTLSEVATIDWVKRKTCLPVPEVVAYQPDREKSAVDFEWIIMRKLPGKPLADAWRYMTFATKKQLVQQFAIYYSSTFRNQLRLIGNLYPDSDSEVGRIVCMLFFWRDHIYKNIDRGPFRCSRDWIAARLSLHEQDCCSTIARYKDKKEADSDDEADNEDAERTKVIIERLKTQVEDVYPCSGDGPEPSVLFHDDLSGHNILVDERGKLTGVVDWECVSAVPLWKACSLPAFLEGRPRESEPELIRYNPDDPDTLYWEHLQDYERTCLRGYFLEEMRRLEPKWIEVFDSSQVQRDFDYALHHCDSALSIREIEGWLDDICATEDKKRVRSFDQRIWDVGTVGAQ